MLKALIPYAVAGVIGWLVPRWLNLRKDWQRAVLAALAGAIVGWLVWLF